jgi:hypothetical protein
MQINRCFPFSGILNIGDMLFWEQIYISVFFLLSGFSENEVYALYAGFAFQGNKRLHLFHGVLGLVLRDYRGSEVFPCFLQFWRLYFALPKIAVVDVAALQLHLNLLVIVPWNDIEDIVSCGFYFPGKRAFYLN